MHSRSRYQNFVSLMCSSGIMLLVCGVPGMIVAGLLEYWTGKMDEPEAFVFAGSMTLLTAVTRAILLPIGLYLDKRLRRTQAG